MKLTGKRGFTLVEIMLALGISAIIMVGAVAPLVFIVNRMDSAQKSYIKSGREQMSIERIFQDTRGILANASFKPCRVLHRDRSGLVPDDLLILWSSTSANYGGAIGCVVYGIAPEAFGSAISDGLYRWVLSGDKTPEQIDATQLRAEDARLVIPNVTGLRISVLQSGQWVDDYSGATPEALKITCKYKDTESIHEGWLPHL